MFAELQCGTHVRSIIKCLIGATVKFYEMKHSLCDDCLLYTSDAADERINV